MVRRYSSGELDHIAVEVHYVPFEGCFIKTFGELWQLADVENKERLAPLFQELVEEYGLDKYLNYDMGKNMERRMVEECL